MRNLQNLGHWIQKGLDDSQAPVSCAWDTTNNDIICAYGPTKEDTLVTLQRWNQVSTASSEANSDHVIHIAAWDAPCPSPDIPCDKILDIRHFPDSSSTCIVFAGGDVVVVRESPLPDQDKIEILGSVDVGISAASWSPDEELLVILTNAATLLYMSREFEGITDVTLSKDDLKASKHVSVGWGKAETQFRGKGAKVLRDPTMPEKVDQGLRSDGDNGAATISWRGDGAYVAVNSLQESDRRVIRIYNRDGELDGVTEPTDYLEHALSWRPAGNLMAGIQRLNDRIDVVFFERNGLRHGQFSLRLSNAEIKTRATSVELKWNQDSTILAVCLSNSIQLWTMGNYHYYLKQEIVYQEVDNSSFTSYFAWHPENPLLFAIGQAGSVQRSECGWRIASGTNVQPFDYGLTSVIDGRILKLTPLKLSNVPPPMAHLELKLSDNIVDVTYLDVLPSGQKEILMAVLDTMSITLYGWNLQEKPLHEPRVITKIDWRSELSTKLRECTLFPRQICFIDQNTIAVLVDDNDPYQRGTNMVRFDLQQKSNRIIDIELNGHLRELLPFYNTDRVGCLQWYSDGRISEALASGTTAKLSSFDISQIATASNIQSLVIRSIAQNQKDVSAPMIFGLRKNGMLFANERCLAKDCTSFLATMDHLIFTTSQHLLKSVHLANVATVDDLIVPPDTPEVDERCRAVERGARLVNVIPSSSAIILQMPRGNLETIYPRALVLPVIRNSISAGRYKKAFLTCRNHRVDMNIIHDHAPKQFLNSVEVFIEQVKKVEHIDLFLSQLRDEDVSTVMYKETLPQTNGLVNGDHAGSSMNSVVNQGSKVNRICNAFLDVLQTRRTTNLQNLITAYICQNPPALEQGLCEIAELKRTSPDEVSRSVEHICFLADVNRLFDAALGMYSLDMALLIAQQSQRDPREYMPFLQKLKEMNSLRMKVDIDNHLHKYSKVLQHLYELDDFEAFQKHMIKHELYNEAIEIYRYKESRLVEIMKNYALYLESKSRHKDAGIAYEYLKDYRPAAEFYLLAHMWQEALSCATLVPLDPEQLKAFAIRMADSLVELKDYKSAAIIHLDYLHDIDAAARLFCRGYFYADASRLLSLHKRQDLLETVLDTGLSEGQANITELLAEIKGQINAQVPRIKELRIKKAEEPLTFYDGGVADSGDVPDNVSLAGTNASTVGGTLFTRYTNRTGTVATNATRATSKKRLKEERKRARGKKGSVYEEEYLINSVARLIERVNLIGEEVQRLVIGLMRRGMRERARAVEAAMLDVTQLCKDYSPEVFGIPAKEEPPSEGYKPTGGDGVFAESMEQVRTPREPPTIKTFEKLSILGG